MVDFIIHEKSNELKNCYEMLILKFIGNRDEKFKIIDYDNNVRKSGRNIYILSSDNFEEVLNIAKNIRNNDDWHSQIIIISNLKCANYSFLNNKLLILDYIDKNSVFDKKLKETLYTAYNIISKDKTLDFSLNGEVHKIPYRDILYIEKGNNQNHSIIYTNENEYIIKDTINNLEEKLDDAFFMKTHRSCIVNLSNVDWYDCCHNIIHFNNKTIDLISREKRQILKSKLLDEHVKN